MKKSFFTGMITGLFSALVIVVAFGGILLFTDVGSKLSLVQVTEAKGDDGSKDETESLSTINYQRIVNKLEFLQALVDKNFLEGSKNASFEEGVYKGFIDSLKDPYSVYYTEEEYNSLMESSSGKYCGIGATVTQDAKTGIITIVKPFAQGPAYKAGIKPGDIISKVGDEEVTGEDLTKVVSKMKGEAGTKVTVTIEREGEAKPLKFTITRKEIEVPTIESKMLSGKIGYVSISEFDEVTVKQFNSAIDKLEKDGMKALVVDVRNNPGGRLDSVVEILDRLLPPKLVVYQLDKNNKRTSSYADDEAMVSVPMAVLINGNSASASEIFAGTLQDYKAATIVGTTSFGKGIVQQIFPISDGTAVKLTISKYYTPKGRNIHKIGITPDVTVELDEALKKEVDIPVEKDNQLQKAISLLKKKIK
jgi:carboxyl-terminal processing protease